MEYLLNLQNLFSQGTGANFLLSGIYLTFLFSSVLLVLTTAHFVIGGILEKVCSLH